MKKFILPIFIIFLGFLLDQASKGALLYMLTGGVPLTGSAWTIVPDSYIIARVTEFFNIVFTWNHGTSFSMFRSLGESAPIIMIIVIAFIAGFLGHYLFFWAREKFERVSLALILGGALGNLVDRVRFGAVIDFLDVHGWGWHWPAFNIADILICAGVGLYILCWLIKGKRQKEK